jgi:hypothetical protein
MVAALPLWGGPRSQRASAASTAGQNTVLAMSCRLALQRQYPRLAISSRMSSNSPAMATARAASTGVQLPRGLRSTVQAASATARPT